MFAYTLRAMLLVGLQIQPLPINRKQLSQELQSYLDIFGCINSHSFHLWKLWVVRPDWNVQLELLLKVLFLWGVGVRSLLFWFSSEFISYLGFFAQFDSVVKAVLKFATTFKMRVDIYRFLEAKYSWHYLNK